MAAVANGARRQFEPVDANQIKGGNEHGNEAIQQGKQIEQEPFEADSQRQAPGTGAQFAMRRRSHSGVLGFVCSQLTVAESAGRPVSSFARRFRYRD